MREFVSVCLAVIAVMCNAQTIVPKGEWVKANNPNIKYIGRVSWNNSLQSPMFTFPGVQIISAFTGTSIRMVAKPNSGYFMAQIDDCEAFKVSFNSKRDSVVTLAVALPKGEHSVKLMYVTEGYERRAEFRGFILDEGCNLIEPAKLPERKIEFIGNSITCGYGIESVNESDHYQDETCNHYYTYAARTARSLHAQHVVVARSGIGVYRNYDGPVTGDKINMNTEYKHTLLYDEKDGEWCFACYVPQVVCTNLGTNDTSTKGADFKLLKKGYADLLHKVRNEYKDAKIVFLSGSMMEGKALAMAKKAMNEVTDEAHKNGDKEVYRFDFTPQNGDLGYGADWHPSIWQHEKMAGELTAYLRVLMGWR